MPAEPTHPDTKKSHAALRKELRQTKQLLHLVLETSRMSGAIVDTDLRHTWVHNPAPEPTDDEILGHTDAELFSEDIARPTTDVKQRAIETDTRIEREFSFVKPWGIRWYRAAAEPAHDAKGRVVGARFAALDISDRFKLLERTSDAVFTVDRDWRITSWNTVMAERTGISPEAMVGRSLWQAGRDLFNGSFPSELATHYRHAMETGKPAEFLHYVPKPFDYWVEIRLFPDASGLSVFSRDVTDQVQRNRALERQEFLFQRAQELSDIGVWELDLTTDALWWSDGIRRIHGVTSDYTPTLEDGISFYHPEDRPTIEAAVQQAIETGTWYSHRLRIVRPSGEVRHVLARGEVVRDADGVPERLRGTLQDVTDLERTKRELRTQNERLDAFGRVVAHDIRSPLSVAVSFADLAQSTGDLGYLDRVQTALHRINRLVQDLMVLARTKLHASDMAPVPLQEVAQNAWDSTVIDEGPTLVSSPSLDTIKGHAGLLTELFENLFRNAIAHGGEDVTVRVGALDDGGFYVEDTGPGISPEQREQVFDHGFTTHPDGTGMGLSIVQEIAAAHQWTARIVDAVSGGARFEFWSEAAPSTSP